MGTITDDPSLQKRRFVFSDLHDAGRKPGALIRSRPALVNPVVLAIPSGGVPVGVALVLGDACMRRK
jgi:hypothetical protein